MGKPAVLSLKILGDATGAQKAAAATKKEISGLEQAAAQSKKMLGGAGLAAGAALMLGVNEAITQDGDTRKMAASIGLTEDEMKIAGKMAGGLYADNYGESMEQVNETIAAVGSTLTTMTANGGADVERLSKKALDLSNAFGVEVSEGVNTAGILMKTGLAKDGDEAMDLLVGSMQKMPKAMQAELLPVMDEYSTHFAALGFDGSTAFGIMAQASKGGAIQMDKTGDALKEFTIRATDGSKTTGDALASMGLDAGKMANDILAGGSKAQGALGEIVNGLTSIKDPSAQAQAAIALFGTPLEDLGTDKIPDFLYSIDPMGDAFDSLAGSADAMGKTLNEGPSASLETLKRTATQSFTEMGAAALPVLAPMLAVLTQYAPVIAPIALGIAGLAVLVYGVSGAMAAWNAVQMIGKGVMAASTAAQWLFNAALTANPIGLVVMAIAALVAGVILAYNNIGWFKDFVDTCFAGIQFAVSAVVTWLTETAWPFIQQVWDNIGKGAQLLYETWIRPSFEAVQRIIKGVMDTVKSLTQAGLAILKGDFSGAMRHLEDAVRSGVDVVITWFNAFPGRILGAIGSLGSLLWNKGSEALAGLGNGISSGWNSVMTWLWSLGTRILNAIGSVNMLLWNAAIGIMQGFYDGLLSGWNTVTNFVGGIAQWIADHKGPLSYDKRLLKPAGTAIMGGLLSSMKSGMQPLQKFLTYVTDSIAGVGDVAPRVDLLKGRAAALLSPGAGSTSAQSVTVKVEVNTAVGADKVAIGREIKEVLDTYLKTVGIA